MNRAAVISGKSTFVFKHALIQDAMYPQILIYNTFLIVQSYKTLTTKQRRKIHLLTAEWYKTTYAKDLISVSANLQHHYFMAGMKKEGMQYCLKAA